MSGYIYFIAPAHLERIKIGFSENPTKRLRQLNNAQGPHKLYLLTAVRGARSSEQFLHRVFRPSRVHGEWFIHSVLLNRLISDCLHNGALPEWVCARSEPPFAVWSPDPFVLTPEEVLRRFRQRTGMYP